MSHARTSVSASVIKSTSRFAPKAVPRKKQVALAPKGTPARTHEDRDESENGVEEFTGSRSVDQSGHDINKAVQTSSQAVVSPTRSIPESALPIETSLSDITEFQSGSVASATAVDINGSTGLGSGSILEKLQNINQSVEEPTSLESSTRKRRKTTSSSGGKSRSRKESLTSSSEEVVISPATTTMSEMCVDKRTGRKSSRYAELQEAERQRRKQSELKREKAEVETSESIPRPVFISSPKPTAQTSGVTAEEDDMLLPVTSSTARVMTDENGNIILDQSSLQVDRHAVHPSTLTGSLIHTTETVFSSKVNSATYTSNRTHANSTIRWLPADNEEFYNALQMFGTDFQMIAEYLGGGKTRRHIKNKFDREEKSNEAKVTWALKNRKLVDIAGLEEKRGSKLKDREELMKELEGFRAEREAVMALPPLSESQVQDTGGDAPGPTIITDAIYRD
jgi:Myb DNA-binding like